MNDGRQGPGVLCSLKSCIAFDIAELYDTIS